jgi:hypothetical protein
MVRVDFRADKKEEQETRHIRQEVSRLTHGNKKLHNVCLEHSTQMTFPRVGSGIMLLEIYVRHTSESESMLL